MIDEKWQEDIGMCNLCANTEKESRSFIRGADLDIEVVKKRPAFCRTDLFIYR